MPKLAAHAVAIWRQRWQGTRRHAGSAGSARSAGPTAASSSRDELGLLWALLGAAVVVVAPLPTLLLDALWVGHLGLAVLVVVAAVSRGASGSFTNLPSLLLFASLWRLVLHVASTRLILSQGDAGAVIDGLGQLAMQAHALTGIVVFLMVSLVQFLVIAKGAERIAEVGARFALDALPGWQMSIDADLRSGVLQPQQAAEQRTALLGEGQFYGAMDGAMKFVRGDTLATIAVVAVNLFGGVFVGVTLQKQSFSESWQLYGGLAIGEGLAAQVPALLITMAAAMVVTRAKGATGPDASWASELLRLFRNAKAPASRSNAVRPAACLELGTALAEHLGVDTARRRVGRGDGLDSRPTLADELHRVGVALWEDLGVELPEVEVRLVARLEPYGYRFSVQETPLICGRLSEGDPLRGNTTMLGAVLEEALRRQVDALVGVQEAQAIVDRLASSHPALVRSVIPGRLSIAPFADLLRQLVAEGISLHSSKAVLEVLAALPGAVPPAHQLLALVRRGLAATISRQHAPSDQLRALALDPGIEEALREGLRKDSATLRLAPELATTVVQAVATALRRHAPTAEAAVAATADVSANATSTPISSATKPPVIMCRDDVRAPLRQLLRPSLPDVAVLGYNELLPATRLDVLGRIDVGG